MADSEINIYKHNYDGVGSDPEPLRFASIDPPWRSFSKRQSGDGKFEKREMSPRQEARGRKFKPTEHEARLVDAAIVLRRPLLVQGAPGIGKTSLAYSIAWQLGLGDVLRWSITSRSTLTEALYQYDAIARLQSASLARDKGQKDDSQIGDYITLGPLGTALLPNQSKPYQPRVLLVDEIDKSDIDLPNDLLHVLEEGVFEIPEIARAQIREPAKVRVHGSDQIAEIGVDGRVHCTDFPIVIMTTNNEREFSAAFKRRCLAIQMDRPDKVRLQEILALHLPESGNGQIANELVAKFVNRVQSNDELAIDQLLCAVHLAVSKVNVNPLQHQEILDVVLRNLKDGA